MADDAAIAAAWSTEAWREEATSWLDDKLADIGLNRTGRVAQPHLERWSTVLSAETDSGRVWLKAMTPATSFEIDLYELLVRLVPDHVLHPLASDRERGWMILPDGGTSLAERLNGEELIDAMVIALPQYASLQRAMTDSRSALVAIGLTDFDSPHLLDSYRSALAGFDEEPFADRLTALESDYEAWCAVVAGSPLPATLDHNDLHPWNILGLGDPIEADKTKAVFYDWGDSVVAHPLGSAGIPISRVRRMLDLDEAHPGALRMRDAYLEVFTDVAPRRHLVELFDASCRLAKATRAILWDGSAQDIGLYLADVDNGFGGM